MVNRNSRESLNSGRNGHPIGHPDSGQPGPSASGDGCPDANVPGESAVVRVAGGAENAGDRPNRGGVRAAPPLRKLPSLTPRDHGPSDDPFWQECPYLCCYLYRGSWDEITLRDPGTLLVIATTRMVNLTLKCPTEAQQITVTATSFNKALELLELYCRTGEGPWKEMTRGTGAQKVRDARKKALDERRSGIHDPT